MAMLWVHVGIALSSLIIATFSWVKPTKGRIHSAGFLVALTLITGTVLVVNSPGHMVQACTSGLVYLGAVSVALIMAQRKLLSRQ
jgi:hypothetical protein